MNTPHYLSVIASHEPDLLAYAESLQRPDMCVFDQLYNSSHWYSFPLYPEERQPSAVYPGSFRPVEFVIRRPLLFLDRTTGSCDIEIQCSPVGREYRSSIVPCKCSRSCRFDLCVYEVQYWSELRRAFIAMCICISN
jgi:hypothetical protein